MRSSGVSACNQVKLSGEVKQRDEFSWSFHSENIVAVPGFKSGFNRCDFQVNFKGAQLVCHDNPPQFHSLGIRLCSLFNVCQAALPNNLFTAFGFRYFSFLATFSVCLSLVCHHFVFFCSLLSHYLFLSFIVLYSPFPRIFPLCSLLVLCDSFG